MNQTLILADHSLTVLIPSQVLGDGRFDWVIVKLDPCEVDTVAPYEFTGSQVEALAFAGQL